MASNYDDVILQLSNFGLIVGRNRPDDPVPGNG